jgi:parallel beta-helix repeat protein
MEKLRGLTVVALVVGLAAGSAESKIIHVKMGAAGDGSSWASAYWDLQNALDDAEPNDEIWVAAGTYKPTYDYNMDNGDRGKHFRMINGVGIYGGFPDTGDPVWGDRDPTMWETILSGDLDGNDGPARNPEDLLDDPNRSENCYNVFSHHRRIDIDPNAVLDGFTITGGNANYNYGGSYTKGGGMYNYDSDPTIAHCIFRCNSAEYGGGIYNNDSNQTVSHCTFTGNAAEYGGGMYCSNSDNLTLEHCTFTGNFAELGGGVYHEYSDNSMVRNCTFSENSRGEYGGGIYSYHSKGTVTGCIFRNNYVEYGAGIHNEHFVGSVTNCTFTGNSAYNETGGGMCNEYGTPIVTGCTFTGNIAAYGGGILNHDSNATIAQCTFCDNRSLSKGKGRGMHNWDGSVVVTDCIFWGNTCADNPQIGGTAVVTFSNVQGGWEGMGNIDVDPCYADPGHWEDPCGTPDYLRDDIFTPGDYHLKSQAGRYDPDAEMWVYDNVTSPCIDAGDPMSPIGHEPFPNGGIVNMGAYGAAGEASKSYFGTAPCETIAAGDINGDCEVNFLDFCLMALHWPEDNDL